MKHTIITEVENSDRNIVMFIEDHALVGINFWYGQGDPISPIVTDFIKPDRSLFDCVRRYYNNAEYDVDYFFPSPDFDHQVKRLNCIISAIHELNYLEEQISELQFKMKNLTEKL
jgi:hypothetical protein